AEQDSASFLDLLIGVAEGAGFDGASGGVGARIEVQDHGFASQILQREFLSVLVLQSKLGSLIIDIHEGLFSTEVWVEDSARSLNLERSKTTDCLQKMLIPQIGVVRHRPYNFFGSSGRAARSGPRTQTTADEPRDKSLPGKQEGEERQRAASCGNSAVRRQRGCHSGSCGDPGRRQVL